MNSTIFAIATYLLCGILAYGFCLAYFQREYVVVAEEKYGDDKFVAFVVASTGPIGLFVLLITGRVHHGLMFRRPKK